MVYKNPQEWLDKNYPNKNQAKTIDLYNLDFEHSGELIIDNYPNLEEIDGSNIFGITKLSISNCSRLERVSIYNFKNNQELILYNLPNLRVFDCRYNQLTSLDLSKFPNLQRIYCSNNLLTQTKLPPTAKEKLAELDLSNNNFPDQDSSFLSHLVNLKKLYLGNNKFKGSLELLKEMSKLKELIISDTDIDSGLEYLPQNVENFRCSADVRKDAKCRAVYSLLEAEGIEEENFSQKLQEYKQ